MCFTRESSALPAGALPALIRSSRLEYAPTHQILLTPRNMAWLIALYLAQRMHFTGDLYSGGQIARQAGRPARDARTTDTDQAEA